MNKKKAQMKEAFIAAVIPTEFYIVTRDSKPCTLVNVSGMHKGGVLIPGQPVIAFGKMRDVRRAINRTERAREKLRGSLVSEWMRQQFPSFTDGATFEIVPGGHQGEPRDLLPVPAAAAS
jgi:hypothetical protein